MIVPDVAQDGLHSHRVQPGGGLVQNEHPGLHGDDPRDGHPPLLAAGELKGGLFQLVVPQSHEAGGLPHPAVHLPLVQPHVFRAEGDVLVDGLLKELVLRVLEHQPHLEPSLTSALGIRPDVLPLEEHLAGGGLEQAVEMLDQGGLARAGVADDAQVFPGVGGEVHFQQRPPLEGGAGAVNVGELFGLQNCFHPLCSILFQ